ncbi:MAG: DUF4832 domain-containing protein [Deltaproteobacteria bacterium]|nr:DUF4832 domain-containing protein [Deltaproteobacteria bacterium]
MSCSDDETTTSTGTGGTSTGGGGTGGTGGTGASAGNGGIGGSGDGDVTVEPTTIDDVLFNPGMGFADFHFGWWCNLPPITYSAAECAARVLDHWPENYPSAGTSYFRWNWRQLEPVREQIDFAMIDRTIESANALGETLSFRVMTLSTGGVGVPAWMESGTYAVPGQWLASGSNPTFWPDYRDATFQSEHARFVSALAERYEDHPGVDHVDIGSVGCWGEWNTACLDNGGGIIGVFNPQNSTEEQAVVTAYQGLIDHYLTAFTETPVVMLGIGSGGGPELDVMVHASQGGAGWRVDCWGDWGIFGSGWNHHEDDYPAMVTNATNAYPAFADTWMHAPIQLEVCGTMPDWEGLGWTTDAPDGEVYKTFQFALDQHASVLNAKSSDIPSIYTAAIDELLVENGYRFVIDSFNHFSVVTAGDDTTFVSNWSNLGVAPHYLRRTLSYRLVGSGQTATLASQEDTRTWLPGSWQVSDTVTIPSDLPAGTYDLEAALVDRAGTNPATEPLAPLHLAIEGRGDDGWYAISELTVE